MKVFFRKSLLENGVTYLIIQEPMEDYLIREIDKIGKLLQAIAQKLGLYGGAVEEIPQAAIQAELTVEDLSINLEEVLQQDNPICYLVEQTRLSDESIEVLVDLLFHSDLEEGRKQQLLKDALAYLDHKGYISFRLHALALN